MLYIKIAYLISILSLCVIIVKPTRINRVGLVYLTVTTI